MTKAGDKLIESAKEALAIAKGEQPAPAVWVDGFMYVPASEAADTIAVLREACHGALGSLKALGAENGWASDALRKALGLDGERG